MFQRVMSNLVRHSASALRRYRKEISISLDDLARKSGISFGKLAKAEEEDKPIFKLSQLESIARLLFVPAVYLTTNEFIYTHSMPNLVDFRNKNDISEKEYEYKSLIREFCNTRDNYIYVLESIGESPKKFSLDLTGENAQYDAQLIEDYFGFHKPENKKYAKDDYYLSWRGILESQDVLVLEKGRERYGSDGLSIYFDEVPIITIFSAGQDPSRRLFTMIHELVHLGLKQSVFDGALTLSDRTIERYCDEVAGHVIAPEELINKYFDESKDLAEIVGDIRKDIKASRPAIAIQLYMTNKIERWELDEFLEQIKPPKAEEFGGLKKQHSVIHYFGSNFVQIVMNAMWQDSISSTMAKNILGINDKRTPEAFSNLKEMVF